MKLDEIRENVSRALERVGLERMISLDEIERELSSAETAFRSLLLLGILSRIMHNQDNAAAELFIPAATEWKNYLPHQDLRGLSPAEHIEKYPPGKYEIRFIAEMMKAYQARLEGLEEKAAEEPTKNDSPEQAFDVESDFDKFQAEYLTRVPLEQLFGRGANGFMTVKEIITEERRNNGRPEDMIDKIGVKIFAENTAEGAGNKIAQIEDTYISAVEELAAMQANPKRRSSARIRALRHRLARDEPYHRCGPAPHQFYLNYAMTVLLDEGDRGLVVSLLDRALAYQPDYALAVTMKRRLQS